MPWNLSTPAVARHRPGFAYEQRPAARIQFAKKMAAQLLAAGAGFLTATGRAGRVQGLRLTPSGSKLFTAVFDDGEACEYLDLMPLDFDAPGGCRGDDDDTFYAEQEIVHKYEIIFVKPAQES